MNNMELYLTTILHGFIRPVLAVLHTVAHLAAVYTFPVFTAELLWCVTFCNCIQIEKKNKKKKHVKKKEIKDFLLLHYIPLKKHQMEIIKT